MSTPATSTGPTPPSGTSNPVPLRSWFKAIIDWIVALSPAGSTVYDTGWLPVAPRVDVVAQAAEVRRIGSVLHFRGTLINGASSPETAWPAGVHALGDLPPEVGGSWTSGTSARTISGNTPGGIPVALQAWVAGRTVTIYQPGGGTASQAVLAGLSGLAIG